MNDKSETALWAWFLFESGLPTGRAKSLLQEWLSRGLTLSQALNLSWRELGLSPQEAARVHPPSELAPVTALRSDNGYAPAYDIGQGLQSLPPKLRPALLFYHGEVNLLNRPLVYLAAAALSAEEQRSLHEAISLLVDEPLLLGVYEASPQLPDLLEEIAYGTGEAVVFARTGLAIYQPTEAEAALIEQGRLIIVSPLPAGATYQPAWDAILQQVAAAAAQRVLLTGEAARTPGAVPGLDLAATESVKVLALTPEIPEPPLPSGCQTTQMPADVLLWVDNLLSNPSLEITEAQEPAASTSTVRQPGAPYWVGPELTELLEEDLGPPPSPDDILNTLSKGGVVPEALRRRIQGESKT